MREDVGEFDTGARGGHHVSDGVTPGGVMGGLFVGEGIAGGAVDFNEEEVGGLIVLLEEVEAGDAGLMQAGAGVGDGGVFERLDVFGLDGDMDMNDEHRNSLN